jgi:glycerate 2-kinase
MPSEIMMLRSLFDAALAAVQARHILPRALPPVRDTPLRVIGAGKAAAAMVATLERCWTGPLSGCVVVPYGHAVPSDRIEILQAGHPLPDQAARAGAQRVLELARQADDGDTVLCLLSGGASALLCAPPPGIGVAEKAAITAALLRSGARIDEINCVRKHLSLIKGGRLAAAAFPARMLCLALSDVPRDELAVIASGPTVGDPTTCAQALAVLDRHGVSVSDAVRSWLGQADAESVKPGALALAHAETRVIASSQTALRAAARRARQMGVRAIVLGTAIEGEARDIGRAHARLALAHATRGERCVLLSGGETTVKVRGHGRGGRNSEYLLSLFEATGAHPEIAALAADTDGIDGTAACAGACFDARSRALALESGLQPREFLDINDSHEFFAKLGTLIETGPTLTNVNDFRAILINGSR